MTRELPKRLARASSVLQDFDWWPPDYPAPGVQGGSAAGDGSSPREGPGGSGEAIEDPSREIRSQIEDLFYACYDFLFALNKAGGLHLIGERADLPALTPVRRPAPWVPFGLPRLPGHWSEPYAAFEDESGGPQVLGARLICWCAIAHAPEEFGFVGVDDYEELAWERLPWVREDGGRLILSEDLLGSIRAAARAVCECLESQGPATAMGPPAAGGPQVGERTEEPVAPDWASYAIGKDHVPHWRVFRKYGQEWRGGKRFKVPKKAHALLSALLEGGGMLDRRGAVLAAVDVAQLRERYRRLQSRDDAGSTTPLRGQDLIRSQVRPAISRLRDLLKLALEVKADPIPAVPNGGYRLAVAIGMSLERDEDGVRRPSFVPFDRRDP